MLTSLLATADTPNLQLLKQLVDQLRGKLQELSGGDLLAVAAALASQGVGGLPKEWMHEFETALTITLSR